MCGFVGFVDAFSKRYGEDLAALARRAAETLRHRGPDDSGVWVDNEAGVALGHQRLSIIDLSAEGHQPMVSACGRYVIAFNGEIYNFRDLRKELESEGAAFRGHSDTEVLLEAAVHWGLDKALERSNGMFAFALWDTHKRTLHLARDRMGQKPLYYGWLDGVFLAGSELKALEEYPDLRFEIDRGALALFLRHGYIPAPYSIYKGIYKLPPATLLSVPLEALRNGGSLSLLSGAGGGIAPRRYWSAREAAERGISEPFTGREEEAIEALDELVADSVKLCSIADVPLGAFLSGGIDSSLVVAQMQAQSTRPVRTFSIGFHDWQYDEAASAAEVARHLGTDHTELYVSESDALDVIPDLPRLYDEPFADSSQIPTYLVSKLARQHVKVALSGDGGDELFGGYERHAWGPRVATAIGIIPLSLRRMFGRLVRSVSVEKMDTFSSGMSGWMRGQNQKRRVGEKMHKLAHTLEAASPEDLYLRLSSQGTPLEGAVLDASGSRFDLKGGIGWPGLGGVSERIMLLDAEGYLHDDILTKVDRASMGVSLEARIPLLDHRIFEFAWRIPMGMKIRDGQGKWLLRQLLYRYVPRELIERPKMGFGVPLAGWLRGELHEWAESHLSDKRLREESFFDSQEIRGIWSDHISARGNCQHQLWRVLMFQAWLEGRSVSSL